VWAVGARVLDFGEYLLWFSIVEHWDGSQWTIDYNLPGVLLNGVDALAADDVWAVGTYSVGTLIVHWDGTEWTTVPSPDPGHGGDLRAVDAVTRNDLWAAGYFFNEDDDYRTLIQQAPSATQGTVVGGTAVSGATVSWFGPTTGTTTTNEFGQYAAAGLPAGDYTFIAAYGGCDPDTATVTVIAGKMVTQNFQIQC
jgi:hypothetical protein